MKKFLSLLLCTILLTALLSPALAANNTFTLMIYLCGTDLETQSGAASADLQEIVNSRVTASSGVTVYIQTGGTSNWRVSGISDRKTERWVVTQKGLQLVDNVKTSNMGSADTFADFLEYGFDNYPADRYGLIMWDHGSGASGGLCYDELTRDPLYYPEIYAGLKKGVPARERFAFIGFDACLMASYELANHIVPFADYMIASEELEPGSGWDYDAWLPTLVSNPGVSIPKLGRQIVDSFIQSTGSYFMRGDYATLSVCDLRKMDQLTAAVEEMGVTLGKEIANDNFSGISRLRQSMRSFGEIANAASDMIDMSVFASSFARFDKQAAQSILDALEEVVIYSNHTNNLSNISGLSILVPYSTRSKLSSYLPHYETLGLSPNYSAFVKSMADQMSYGSTGSLFSNIGVGQQSVQSAQVDWFSQFFGDQDSYYSEAESFWGDYYEQPGYDQGSYSFDSFLSSILGIPSTGGYDAPQPTAAPQEDPWAGWSQVQPTSAPQYEDDFDNFLNSLLGITTPQPTATSVPTMAPTSTPAPTVWAQEQETAVPENPFAGIDSEYAYTIQLTQEQLEHLGSVEANLLMDVSDPDFECYVELGYVQDVIVDWERGNVYGLFDGTWATLDGQMVCMYDQIVNDQYIRSLIPVTLNGEETYLLVIFDDETPGGRVVGTTEGYNEEGLPVRGVTELKPGDEVCPLYSLIYWNENDEQCEEPFFGDVITVGKSGTIPFEYTDVESDAEYAYGFCLTDIYGDSTFTDFVGFSF